MNLTRLLGLYLAAGLLWSFAASAQVIYVDVDAAGIETGSNWTDAYTDLQSALAWATAGWEIWVAEGQYVPTSRSDRTISFVIPDGVQLYGGFDGTEAARDERNWTIHESILSGDVGVPDDSTDNSYNVIDASNTSSLTAIDGFTVRHGRANNTGVPPFDRGGGLYASHSHIIVRNSIFRWNVASLGGGIFFESASPTVEDCLFDTNLGVGAVYDSAGTPALVRITISNNSGQGLAFFDESAAFVEDGVIEYASAVGVFIVDSSPHFVRAIIRGNGNPKGDGGGVIIQNQSSPIFEDCLIEDNTAAGKGGGVLIEFVGANGLFVDTVFRNNNASASSGGGAFVASEGVFLNCSFERNHALGDGAGLGAVGTITVIGSTFLGNRSLLTSSGGGALSLVGAPQAGQSRLVANSIFVGNTGDNGGAIFAFSTEDTDLINVTFAENKGATTGGAIYASNADGLEIRNAVLWGDQAPLDDEVHIAQGGAPTIERSIVASGYSSGIEILDENPLFVRIPDPGPDRNWGTDDDDYGDLRLREGSPGVDYGLQGFLPPDTWDLDNDGDTTEPLPIDLNGDVRVLGAEVDLGVYEGAVVVATEPDLPPADVGLAVYPNPANDYLTIEADAEDIEIVNVLGRVILRTMSTGRIDVSGLPVGVYVVRAGNETRRFTKIR